METKTEKVFMTIRETARTGIISEHTLRLMQKQKRLPCIMCGVKCMVNYPMLLKQLDNESKQSICKGE